MTGGGGAEPPAVGAPVGRDGGTGEPGPGPDGLAGAVQPPRQARSRRTYHRLLEAAAELLGERPFDDITIDEIAERAGYTKGAFYARFDSKAALLRHLVARLTDGALEAWAGFLAPDRWEDATVREIAEAFVHRMVAIYTRSGHVMRVIDREVRLGGDEAVRATVTRLNEEVARGFIALVETRREELPAAVRADVDGAVRYWLMALAAVLRSGFLQPSAGLDGGDPDAMVDRTLRLMAPFLAGE